MCWARVGGGRQREEAVWEVTGREIDDSRPLHTSHNIPYTHPASSTLRSLSPSLRASLLIISSWWEPEEEQEVDCVMAKT